MQTSILFLNPKGYLLLYKLADYTHDPLSCSGCIFQRCIFKYLNICINMVFGCLKWHNPQLCHSLTLSVLVGLFFLQWGFFPFVFFCFNIPLALLCCAPKHRNQIQEKSLEGERWMAGNKSLTYLLLCIPLNTSLRSFPWEDKTLVVGQSTPVLLLRFYSKGQNKQQKSLSAGHLGYLYSGVND